MSKKKVTANAHPIPGTMREPWNAANSTRLEGCSGDVKFVKNDILQLHGPPKFPFQLRVRVVSGTRSIMSKFGDRHTRIVPVDQLLDTPKWQLILFHWADEKMFSLGDLSDSEPETELLDGISVVKLGEQE